MPTPRRAAGASAFARLRPCLVVKVLDERDAEFPQLEGHRLIASFDGPSFQHAEEDGPLSRREPDGGVWRRLR